MCMVNKAERTVTNMNEIQQRVDQMIIHLGGYWRPLSGLARLIEEVGEVGAALRQNEQEALREELLDVFVISTCLANQYAIELTTPTAREEEVMTAYFRLVESAGEVARILNAYEGDKKLKPNAPERTLIVQIGHVQQAVLSIAKRYNVDVFGTLDALIDEKSSRDFGRFDHTPDPITEHSVRLYKELREGRYWGGILAKPFEQIDRYVEREKHLLRFLKIAHIEKLDGFVILLERDGLIRHSDFHNAFGLSEKFQIVIEQHGQTEFLVIKPN